MAPARDLGGNEPRAVQRALALLEAAAQLGSGASAKEIAALAGIPQATAYRLLNLLVADGYLVRVADLSGFTLDAAPANWPGPQTDPSTSVPCSRNCARGSATACTSRRTRTDGCA